MLKLFTLQIKEGGYMTLEQAKNKVINKIKRKGGLYENCGQKELRELEYEGKFEDCEVFERWIESLNVNTIKIYLN